MLNSQIKSSRPNPTWPSKTWPPVEAGPIPSQMPKPLVWNQKTQWSCDHGFNSWPGTLNRWISEVNRAPSSNNTAMITFIRPILKSLSLLFTWKHFIQLTIAHVYTYIYIFIYKPHCSHVCKYIYIHVTYKYVCSHIYIYQICIYAYPHIILKKSPLCITISVYLKGAPNAFSTFFNVSILHHFATCLCHGKCPSSGQTSVSSAPELWLQEDSCICLHSMPHCLCNNFGKILKF